MERPAKTIDELNAVRQLLERYTERACAQLALSQTDAAVLLFLHNNPDKDTASDISRYRWLPKANVSKAVESLMERGYLSRAPYNGDRRRVCLSLTPAAQPAVRALCKANELFFNALFTNFSEAERAAYAAMNTRIADNAKKELSNL